MSPIVMDRIIAIAAEWSRGCSCAGPGHPWECEACTNAMAEAMLRAVSSEQEPTIKAGDQLPGDLVAVPLSQIEDMYLRFVRLTRMGQASIDEWQAMPKELAELRRGVFRQADFGALHAGNWLPKGLREKLRTEGPAT